MLPGILPDILPGVLPGVLPSVLPGAEGLGRSFVLRALNGAGLGKGFTV